MNTGCWNSACASWLSAISTGGPLVLSWFLSSSGWCWAFRSWIYNSGRWQKEVTKRVCSKGGVYFTCRRWIWSERSFFSWHGLEREGVAAPGVFPAGIPSCDGCTIPPTCTWSSSSPASVPPEPVQMDQCLSLQPGSPRGWCGCVVQLDIQGVPVLIQGPGLEREWLQIPCGKMEMLKVSSHGSPPLPAPGNLHPSGLLGLQGCSGPVHHSTSWDGKSS